MDRRVGLEPAPDDDQIEAWLNAKEEEHEQLTVEVLEALANARNQTKDAGEPDIFAYGKLLNYLASTDIEPPDLVKVCAAALWWLSDEIERNY